MSPFNNIPIVRPISYRFLQLQANSNSQRNKVFDIAVPEKRACPIKMVFLFLAIYSIDFLSSSKYFIKIEPSFQPLHEDIYFYICSNLKFSFFIF